MRATNHDLSPSPGTPGEGWGEGDFDRRKLLANSNRSCLGTGASRNAGFTLIEAMVASVVLAILVVGVCSTLTSSYGQSEVVQSNGYAVVLARQLMDEITSKPLADPSTGSMALGPGSFTSRSQYTHVTNYSGYTDTSTSIPLLEGGTLDTTGSEVYQRTVTVTVGAEPSIDTASPTTDFAIVTVSVSTPTGQTVAISRLVPKYSIQR